MAKKKVRGKSKRKFDPADIEFLPKHIAWIAQHPLLLVTKDAMSEDGEIQLEAHLAKQEEYEKANMCPNQMTRNMFEHLRGQGAKLDKLFIGNISKHWSDFERKKAKKIEEEEDEAIADLEKTMHTALGSGT